MTFEQLSKQTGKAGSLLHRYSKRGMPTTSATEALAWIATNVRVKVSAKPQPRKTTTKRAAKRTPRAKPLPPNPYQDARTRQAIAEATEAQMRVLERQRRLVDADVQRAMYARHLSTLREALLQLPARLQSVVAAETDEAKVHNLLQDEVLELLARITEPGA